jgi:hypothetical protein
MELYDRVRADPDFPKDAREHLNLAAKKVRAAVNQYQLPLLSYALPAPAGLTKDQGDALQSLYKLDRSATVSAVRAVLIAINEADNPRCPYCSIGWARQIDHYLPKAAFPEFSVAGTNLVPACADCNWLKGNATVDPDGSRYIHAYLDDDFDQAFLVATVRWNNDRFIVQYFLRQCGSMTDVQFSGLRAQFYDLCLLQRFGREAIQELEDTGFRVTAARQSGRPGLKRAARKRHRELSARYGENHWKSALYAGLALATYGDGQAPVPDGAIALPLSSKCNLYFSEGVPSVSLNDQA